MKDWDSDASEADLGAGAERNFRLGECPTRAASVARLVVRPLPALPCGRGSEFVGGSVKAWKVLATLTVAGSLAACSRAEQHSTKQGAEATAPRANPETVQVAGGQAYSVERVSRLDTAQLPQNSDLKMADGDLAKYAVEGCSLDVAPQYAPTRCDVYVQPDKSGTLIGYAFVLADAKGAHFNTVTTLNERKQLGGGDCYLSGTTWDQGANYEKVVADTSRDFNGRQMYRVFKNGAGDDLVSPVDPNGAVDNEEGAYGVWYLTKEGDKLRIAQERWNYCYKDDSVTVDDVFYRAVSLTKMTK